ncbi:hypothetical protein M948_10760 [Virgibacillus sp. CM-4]|nr:hypothetical protein M948_10760 [Virgibacillus sp. CM-4]
MKLKDKVAIITGGGAGIGKETALIFAKEGAKVVFTDINEDSGKRSVDEIKAIGAEATFIKHDVSKDAGWK